MVDAVGNAGGVQKAAETSRIEKFEDRRRDEVKDADVRRTVRDEVSLSQEAQDIAKAEQAAQEARVELERDGEKSLSGNGRQIDTLL